MLNKLTPTDKAYFIGVGVGALLGLSAAYLIYSDAKKNEEIETLTRKNKVLMEEKKILVEQCEKYKENAPA